MSAFAAALGFLLLIAAARSEDAPKGPKVTHKVSIVDYLSGLCHSIEAPVCKGYFVGVLTFPFKVHDCRRSVGDLL